MNREKQWVRPKDALSERIRVVTTTRVGGVSSAPFDSLNLGLHVGDDAGHVHENRRRMAAALALPSEPAWLQQCHGTAVCEVGVSGESDAVKPENAGRQPFDGALTREPGVVLAIMTADCLPIVIADRQDTAVAAVHAGWRGLAEGIVDQALDALALSPDRLSAWLGPAIGPNHFEVGEDVLAVFREGYPAINVDSAFVETGRPGKYLADLYQLARAVLAQAGVAEIQGGEYCTFADSERFYSYRRDGRASGRMATLAWID